MAIINQAINNISVTIVELARVLNPKKKIQELNLEEIYRAIGRSLEISHVTIFHLLKKQNGTIDEEDRQYLIYAVWSKQ